MRIDRDYEALIRDLLAGVAGGWSYGSLSGWLIAKKLKDSELAAWLREHGEGLGEDAEIRAQLVYLANLNRGDLASVAADLVKGWEPKVDESEKWFDEGITLVQSGKYEEAIASYDQAIEIKPDCQDTWCNRGIALNDLGRYEEAIASYDRAIEIQPDSHQAWYNQGITLCYLGRYAEAIASYDRAIEIQPDYHEAWFRQGNTLRYLGRYKEAIASYDRAIEIEPGFLKTLYMRGITLFSLGRYEEAIASYDRAIAIKPDDHETWSGRGNALSSLGRYEEVIASYDRAIEIKPDRYDAWAYRGIALMHLGRYKEAIASYDRAIAIRHDKYEIWHNRGIAFGHWKGYQSEIYAYHESFQHIHSDTHPEGWGLLQHQIGRAHYQEGKNQLLNHRKNPQPYYNQAIAAYNKALQTLTRQQLPGIRIVTLTRQQFPELRLETLIDLAKVQLAQHNPTAAHETKIEAFDIFRDLLNAQPTFEAKKRLRLEYTSLRQLDVELFIATGDNIRALEAAELDKNERLTLLLAALQEQTISPPHEEMRQLLTSETTGIVYWHLSPENLTTFILTAAQPHPLIWNIDNRTLQTQQLKEWIKTWDIQYKDYRNQKSPKTQPSQNSEPTTNNKAAFPWRKNLTANLMQLRQILDIDNICKQLPANLTNLILIPHGDLHRFPLHVLFLIAQKSQIRGCTYLPSIQVGLNLRDRSSQSYTPLLSVADPATEQAPMPFAQLESAIIRHLLQPHTTIDPQSADLATVETALNSSHASFHFTGHAAYNSRKPEDSALALTDAPLTAKRVAQLNLSSYNMITLAACETAITGRTNITTEYVGLTSAFLQAGAANILSNLWQVDEISNAWFTIYFHQQLLAGRSPAVALTRTQIWLKTVTWQHLADWLIELKQIPHLKVGIVDKLQSHITNTLEDGGTIGLDRPSKYRDPYHWAAFTLTGRG